MPSLALLVCLAAPMGPEEAARVQFHEQRVRTQLAGMGLVIGWAVVNIVSGVAGNFTTTGEVKYTISSEPTWISSGGK